MSLEGTLIRESHSSLGPQGSKQPPCPGGLRVPAPVGRAERPLLRKWSREEAHRIGGVLAEKPQGCCAFGGSQSDEKARGSRPISGLCK